MDNKDELQEEFDLDSIVNEFHDPAGDAQDKDDLLENSLSFPPLILDKEPAAAEPEKSPAPQEAAEPPAAAKEPAEDSGESDLSDIPDPTGAGADLPEVDLSDLDLDGLDLDGLDISDLAGSTPEPAAEAADSEDSTLRFTPTSEDAPASPDDSPTHVDHLEGQTPHPAPSAEPAFEVPEEFIPSPIVFTPRSRLRELKKQLVAGPEKRYYELSEMGLGKLQASIALNLLVVLTCAGVTTLFALDMVPENRLRLVIFSQVLAMLLSGLLGCQLMLDSIGDLFHGKFGLDTLLTITFLACFADGMLCLQELRVPCCAAFSLEMTMALWARYQRRTTEMAQMDTMRKAVRLHGIVKVDGYYQGKPGFLRTEAEVEDFMGTYAQPTTPERIQSFYGFLALLACIAIAVVAGLWHGVSMGVQIFATSLLVAIPASFFISATRPMAILEQRLHMVGSVLCGWKGVKLLSGKGAFPLDDQDLFPQGCTKLNGVKFYGDRDPDEIVSLTTSLITAAGGGLAPVFQQLLKSRDGRTYPVENFRDYGAGGIGGEVCGEPVLLGSLNFLQDMGVEIPEGTMVNQAVYAAVDGQLCAVYAISYAKMRSAAAGIVTLCSYRRLTPVMLGSDFMLTAEFIRAKFEVNARRIAFPDQAQRAQLKAVQPDPEARVLALSTREELVSPAYAVAGAKALSTSTKLGMIIHLLGGILGLLIMLVLAVLGNTELLTPANILLYQVIWAVPGLLVTEWTRTV